MFLSVTNQFLHKTSSWPQDHTYSLHSVDNCNGPPPPAGVVAVSGLVVSGRLCSSFSGPSVLTQGQPCDVDEALPSLLSLTSADCRAATREVLPTGADLGVQAEVAGQGAVTV